MVEFLLDSLRLIFGGDAPDRPLAWGQFAARATLIYFVGIVLIRLGKSRLLSRTTPVDVILAFVFGSVLSRAITGSAPLTGTIVAAATLVTIHSVLTALAYYSPFWGRLIKGQIKILVSDGEINWPNMRHSHISERDLREALRVSSHVDDVSSVQLAVKERSGEIGIVPKPPPPIPQIEVDVHEGVQTIRIVLRQS